MINSETLSQKTKGWRYSSVVEHKALGFNPKHRRKRKKKKKALKNKINCFIPEQTGLLCHMVAPKEEIFSCVRTVKTV
jgi:hypothetical protein